MQNKCKSVQALRGLSFLAVFLYHAGIIHSGGGWGVSIFFILSGFLLMVYHGEENMQVSLESNLKYATRKIGKLYPLHLATTLLAVPLLLRRCAGMEHFGLNVGFRAFLNILLIQSWFPWSSVRYSMNNLSWFLSCMLFLYFMFPVLHNVIQKINSSQGLFVSIVGVWIGMLAYAYLLHELCQNYDLGNEMLKGLTYNFPLYRVGDFSIGCLTGAFYSRWNSKGYHTGFLTHGHERTLNNVLECAGILLFIMISITDWEMLIYGTAESYWWSKTVAFVFPAVYMVWIFMSSRGGIIQWLAKTPLVTLGNISGQGYLIHELILIYIEIIMRKLFGISCSGAWLYIRMLAGLGLTLLAVFLWRNLEKLLKRKCPNILAK